MLHRSTIQLLRIHFSLFLLPVYLFALSELHDINWTNAILVFIVLHLLVYPSSNGYNSYMDRDITPIGGLASPLLPTKQLFNTTVILDIIALVLSIYISQLFALGILLYIIASRAYSYRGIRLKKFPFIGFLTVFIFQGAVIFYISFHAIHEDQTYIVPILPCIISSFLIAVLYPLTQIYQHEADQKDGVTTISYKLGIKGTFIFSMFLFLIATFLLYLRFQKLNKMNHFSLYLLIMMPVVLFFLYWMWKTWKNPEAANFKNSLLMNLLSTICTTIFFILMIILND